MGQSKSLANWTIQAYQFGLYDTSGNVWELVCSKWQDQFNGQEHQCSSLKDFSTKVIRGRAGL